MDEATFDRIARLLGGGMNRRSGLRAALGAMGLAIALPAAPVGTTVAARGRHGRGAEERKPKPEGPCGDGSGKYNHCTKDSDCCTGYCKTAKAKVGAAGKKGKKGKKGGAGRCRCIKGGKPCVDGQTCCGGGACMGGRCKHHKPSCTAANCPNGCCLGGVCQPGTDGTACGGGGGACAVCSSLSPLCNAGTCVTGAWVAKTPLGNGQGSANGQFDWPSDVAVTADGLALYVADQINNRISIWTRASVSAAWQAGTPLGASQPASGSGNSDFSAPSGLQFSADELALYVADAGNDRIAVWTRASATAAWQAGAPIGNGSGTNNDQFQSPYGVAVSIEELALYIADMINNRIDIWTRASVAAAWQALTPLGASQPAPGADIDDFMTPSGVALAEDGLELYIADTVNARIAVWTRASAAAAWTAQTPLGSQGSANDQFSGPVKLALADDDLSMYIADSNDRISIWTRATLASAWQAQTPVGSSAGSADNQLDQPSGVALSADYRWMYVADSANNRIAVWHYE